MQMPGRNYSSDSYSYGFQGQLKDDEIKGPGNSVNYKYRMHDPRIGRFFAVDPLNKEYPWNSPYAFSENKVIRYVELEGLETADPFLFTQSEFDTYKLYIDNNASKKRNAGPAPHNDYGYGFGPKNKHDCVTCVNRGTRVLLNNGLIPPRKLMNDQMSDLHGIGYADRAFTVPFKDADGNPTNSNPVDFLNKSASESISESLGANSGYLFYGLSIMEGYHSAIIAVNNTDPGNPSFNIFDQHGSLIEQTIGSKQDWYSAADFDLTILSSVYYSEVNGVAQSTATHITPLHKRVTMERMEPKNATIDTP